VLPARRSADKVHKKALVGVLRRLHHGIPSRSKEQHITALKMEAVYSSETLILQPIGQTPTSSPQ
jgi:hypothetical protein